MNIKEKNKIFINKDNNIIDIDFTIDDNNIINDNINKIKDKKDIDNITINDINNI
tara:strand:+ start:3901 stop:4065 length:165 start_codon:yes stop_codon:yes gene_type:complete